ncbi:3-oxoacyl-[acyl-carrier protein] reductase [Abditibacterium utsteinense]|uniref:3-oxoacyl-[acyl-carrier protein] reductase n=1 Tax=Abditibacterium utsteinense TaxID=1960156 RepID=A0A2S8SQE7_9BACT|nr:3-oxoacyl-ACP reductase family protein [Abditibacterium utsteinense]PQV62979.1 3-oxoacyl-[acyl-carrier protein] reductase [Abditibacterium utsteinense]
MFDLHGKSALITGSSRGIGAAIALAFAAQGADVAVHFHSDEEAARAVASQIEAMGRRAIVLRADLRDSAQIEILWNDAEAWAPIDILVNNAGTLAPAFLGFMSEKAWDDTLDLNLKSAFLLSKKAARAMNKRKNGRIINISSQAGQSGELMAAHYSAAKAGLLGLTKAAARELAASNVTCNAIAPGFIETDLLSSDEKKRATQLALVPLKRFGRASEVAALATYLASDEAAYVTGQTFAIDGGLRM